MPLRQRPPPARPRKVVQVNSQIPTPPTPPADDAAQQSEKAGEIESGTEVTDLVARGAGGRRAAAERLRAVEGGAAGNPVNPELRAARQAARVAAQAAQGGARGPRAQSAESFAPATVPGGKPAAPQGRPARPPAQPAPVAPPAQAANFRPRHGGLLALAFLLIVAPAVAVAIYLWNFAVDQYVSVAGFAIRTESSSSPFDFLGAFGGGSTTTSKDMDILDNFVTSQQLVAKIDKELDLKAMFSKPQNDPLFAYNTAGTIEDLVDYWNRMVIVNYDNTTGLMQLNVYAFSPEDAQKIATTVLDESSTMINKLAAVAREDTTKYAKQVLDESVKRMADARRALTEFRVKNNIVDPSIDIGSQSSVVGQLNQQLTQAQVELQVLKQGGAADSDPRVVAVQRRIDVINNQIASEQQKVAVATGQGSSTGYAELVADYEALKVDEEFAQKAYLTALASYDAAEAEASHKQVYLATYEEPTVAEASTAPRRWLILITTMVIGFFAWSIVSLIYYALRDRR